MYDPNYNGVIANSGWVCGKCGRSFAPHISECPYCNGEQRTGFATTDVTINDKEWWRKYLRDTTGDPYPQYYMNTTALDNILRRDYYDDEDLWGKPL